MRIDKWLKLSRIIKRRTVAQMACDQSRVYLNDRIVKAGTTVKEGDKVHIELGSRALTVEVLQVPLKAPSAQEASSLYKKIEEIRRPPEKLDWLPAGEDFE
jgi:ribosomal 50S subunit-recycling heat shock protein